MCKYGDFYLHLEIAEKFGVYSVTPLSVYDMIREEGMDPQNPSYVCFRIDPMVIATGGLAVLFRDELKIISVIDEELTLKGLLSIYQSVKS